MSRGWTGDGREELPEQADVVIIGGGIIGCATAYYLAKRGVSVVVVDKGALGYEQSTRNWGWVHQQVRYPHLIPLAVESVRLWERLGDELGSDLEWMQGGNLSLGFSEADAADFEQWGRDAHERGLETEILTRGEVVEMLPGSEGRWTSALLRAEADREQTRKWECNRTRVFCTREGGRA